MDPNQQQAITPPQSASQPTSLATQPVLQNKPAAGPVNNGQPLSQDQLQQMYGPPKVPPASGLTGAAQNGPAIGSAEWLAQEQKSFHDQLPFSQRVSADMANRSNEQIDTLNRFAKGTQSDFSTGYQIGGQAMGLATDVAGEAWKSIPGHEMIEKALVNTIPGNAIKQVTSVLGQILGPSFQKIFQDHPEAAANFAATTNAFNFAGLAEGGRSFAEAAPEIASGVKGMAGDAADAIGNAKDALVEKAQSFINPKREAEILATPESEVAKLNPTERAIWDKNQNSQFETALKQNKETADIKIKTADEAAAKAKAEAELKVNRGNVESDVKAKQTFLNTMRQSSKEYRALYDSEVEPFRDTQVSNQSLKDKVETRFAEDPNQQALVKKYLGLTENVDPLSTKSTSLKPNTSVGELLDQQKALRQTMNKGGRTGTQIFTPEDKAIDDARSIISDTLQEKGVDLSKSNAYWKDWAELRNQGFKDIRPFEPRKTGNFSGKVQNVIDQTTKGVHSEKYIQDLSNKMGTDFVGEQKVRLSQLNEAEQKALQERIKIEEERMANETEIQKNKSEFSTRQTNRELEIAKKERLQKTVMEFLKVASPWAAAGATTVLGVKKSLGN